MGLHDDQQLGVPLAFQGSRTDEVFAELAWNKSNSKWIVCVMGRYLCVVADGELNLLYESGSVAMGYGTVLLEGSVVGKR
ncbi:MAG: hypothetical protein JO033_04685 [Acidobacteriaceae bacterium]|nr:hypothetical protein [Acidobacteriaceae bacterium]MBV9499021.1 hypothetical protein [Acidobacteriaceae bacterium]